ncbi:hypothetical protein HYU06_02020 [Candidatus Woesearchaeota archaeon]|nr:hypothetical protein [Candidatus Woesearchaeota archaeon]
MKLKGKNCTTKKMLEEISKGGGRIGVKDIKEIQKLSSEDKLLEAFFSIIIRLEYQLKANHHNKFHIDWNKVSKKEEQERDINKLWEEFTKEVDKFATIIVVSYSTNLIKKGTYDRLNRLRVLRNDIAHNLTYHEPKKFITKKEVRYAIEEGINLLTELNQIQLHIITENKKNMPN